MGQILHTIVNAKGSVNYVAGVVTDIKESTGEEKSPMVVTMEAKLYNGTKMVNKTIRLNSYPNTTYCQIDRVHKLKLQKGAFIIAGCGNFKPYTPKNGKGDAVQAPLFIITYSYYKELTDTDKTLAILSGTVKEMEKYEDGTGKVFVNIRGFKNNERTVDTKECYLNATLYGNMEKLGIRKSDNIAALAEVYEDGSMEIVRAEFHKRVYENQETKKVG